jgi:hypothetical protein
MIGLFRFGKLKRVEDLKTQPQAAEFVGKRALADFLSDLSKEEKRK